MRTVLAILFLLIAADANGQNGGWVDKLQSPKGAVCCFDNDGRRLDDPEWRTAGESYEVLFKEGWIAVPVDAVVTMINQDGIARVWSVPIKDGRVVRCFLHDKAAAIAHKIGDAPHRAAFEEVERLTGVPWFMVGCLLYRESSLDLDTYLGNGQSLHRVTTVVPKGRGPWSTFADGAVDALKYEGMAGITDWSIERILYWSERFNGQGYFNKGNSPYIWSWTDQYHGGLFVEDGSYSASTVDPRPGVAALLYALIEINPDVAQRLTITETKPMPTTTTAAVPVATTFHVPHIDFAMLEKFVESGAVGLNFVGAIYPPAKAIIAFIPLIEGLLNAAGAIEAAIEGGGDISSVLSDSLHKIAEQVKPSTTVTATSAPTNGMPNS